MSEPGHVETSRNPIWLDFAEDNPALGYCIVHRCECTHECGPCDNLHVHASWVFSWSWSRSSPILPKRNPIRPDVMYFLLAGDKRALHRYARNRRGSVALYCASVCALCAARCGGLRSTRSGQKKVQGWRKGAGSKIAVGPPIPIYIASDRIPSQHVGVGLAQARPNKVELPGIVWGEGIGNFNAHMPNSKPVGGPVLISSSVCEWICVCVCMCVCVCVSVCVGVCV